MKQLILLIAVMAVPLGNAFGQTTEAGQKQTLAIQQKIDELKDEIRETTSGGIVEELDNIPTKEKFTEEELRRIAEVQRSMGRNTKASITKDGWVLVPFGENPTLSCGVNGYCIVALEPGETITNMKVSDKGSWEVDIGSYGPGSLIQTVTLKPKYSDIYSQLLFFTDKGRVYSAFLVSKPVAYRKDGSIPIHSMKVRFTYADNSSINIANIKAKQDAVLERRIRDAIGSQGEAALGGSLGASGAPSKPLNDHETNFELRYIGGKRGDKNPSWRPVRVYADNVANTTYVELPRGYDELPSIFVKGRDGKSQVVTGTIHGENSNIVAINGIHNRVILKQLESGISTRYLTAYEAVRL